MFDFTDCEDPREFDWCDRGPPSRKKLILGGSWSAYWCNGYIYSNDIQQEFDVLEMNDPLVNPVRLHRYDVLNVQSQPSFNG